MVGVIHLAILGDLECVVGALGNGAIGSPGERTTLGLSSDDLDVFQAIGRSFRQSDRDWLHMVYVTNGSMGGDGRHTALGLPFHLKVTGLPV